MKAPTATNTLMGGQAVTFPAILSKVASRADKSYALTFVTRELPGKDASVLLGQLMSEGHVLYSPTSSFEEADIPAEKADSGLGHKSQAQRLRAVIYRLWESKGKPDDDFEAYYRRVTENMIDRVKEELS